MLPAVFTVDFVAEPGDLLPRRTEMKLQLRMTFRKLRNRIEHRAQQKVDLHRAAARQQQELLRRTLNFRITALLDDIHQRVADEGCPQPGRCEHLLLEGEDHQHFRADFRQHREPPFSPHPEVGADIPDDRNPVRVHHQREEEVESGVVDQHDFVGTLLLRGADQAEEDGDEREDMFQHLDHTDDAEFGRVDLEIDVGRGHLRAAHPGNPDRVAPFRGDGPQFTGEPGTVEVAGSLSGKNPYLLLRHSRQPRLTCWNSSTACCAVSWRNLTSELASSSGTSRISLTFFP